MIIENKGEFDISEIKENKHSIKSLDFRNISEIKNLNLLKDFKLLSELKLSTCFIENNKVDLKETSISSLTISNCYFNLNDIVMPSCLRNLTIKLTSINDFKIYENLKSLINLEYDLCDFNISFSIEEINNLNSLEMISITNCKGLSELDSLLIRNTPLKIFIKNTDLRLNINSIHSDIDIELESFKRIKVINNSLINISR